MEFKTPWGNDKQVEKINNSKKLLINPIQEKISGSSVTVLVCKKESDIKK